MARNVMRKRIVLAVFLAALVAVWDAGPARAQISVPGIRHIKVAAPVPAAHVQCMRPIDRYLDSVLAASRNSNLLPLHRQAHYRDYLDVQKLDWGVPTPAQAEAMRAEAEADLTEAKKKLAESAEDVKAARRRASEAPSRSVSELEAGTVAMAAGLNVYLQSRVFYQQAKLGFARCALANEKH